jgi:hypothetical protein
MQSFAPFQCAMNKSSSPCFADVRKIRFELLTDTGKVRVNRVRFDVVTHVDGVEAEGVRGRLYWEVMKAYKR